MQRNHIVSEYARDRRVVWPAPGTEDNLVALIKGCGLDDPDMVVYRGAAGGFIVAEALDSTVLADQHGQVLRFRTVDAALNAVIGAAQ